MTLRYLVDTDWAIHYVNGHPTIVPRLDALKQEGLGLSVVSLAEFYEGVYASTDPERNEGVLNDFLRGVALVGIDVATCQQFGKERGRLRAAKKLIGDFDLLIGATALRHDLTLLSNNRRHFETIQGLRMESS
jgi:tRNA(fMet)-specific endonuclease VapC